MKARIRATGDIYNVIDMNDYRNRIQLEDNNWYTMGEIELIEGNEPDWQHYRIQAAIAAMNIVNGAYNIHNDVERLVHHSVRIADALVAELKRSGDVYAECRRMDAINTASVCKNMTKIQKELQKKDDNADV